MIFDGYNRFCSSLKATSLLRELSNGHIKENSLNFSDNNYLNLNKHPFVVQRAQEYAAHYGVGGQSSLLLLQDQTLYEALAAKIAQANGKQAALLFPSGFQANISVLAALLDPKILGIEPFVFSDRLNHASLHLGCKLAGVRQMRYQHLDMNHLEFLLKAKAHVKNPKFIITESMFSMDGDLADLKTILYLAQMYHAFVYVDDAHAVGIMGPNGYGLSALYPDGIDLTMGSFSKACGSSGAYIACSNILKTYLVNACKGFIYSTALSPMIAAFDLFPSLDDERKNLFDLSNELRFELQKHHFNTAGSCTPIVPIILQEEARTLAFKKCLEEKAIYVSAIRPPTVPRHTARLRVSLNSAHQRHDINTLVKGLQQCL